MNSVKNQIPNLFTLGNLFCGCLAIKFAFEWDLVMAAYLVGLGAILDFFDGFLARILKVQGEMGKQLDSLADLVTFGVVPGVMMFQVLKLFLFIEAFKNGEELVALDTLTYFAFLIPIFSAYRLAKFNIDTRQSGKFIGLPTPANALFFIGIILNLFHDNLLEKVGKEVFLKEEFYWVTQNYLTKIINYPDNYYHLYFSNPYLIVCTVIVFSILLVVELPLFALKFKSFGWKENQIRFVFLGISAAMLIIFQVLAIPFIIILYLLLSIINNYTLKQ